jgi:hypothetical protein
MQGTLGRIVLGFIAAAISVLAVQETIVWWFFGSAWHLYPIPPLGLPRIVDRMFWGGLWGALFALVYRWLPGGMAPLKGLVFGLCIVAVSDWVLLPLIKGQLFGQPNQVLFGGWNPQRMLAMACIEAGFGLGLGIIYRGMIASQTAPADGALRNMGIGGAICAIGLAVTIVTYSAAASAPGGGRYLVAWGAILFGGLQFLRGCVQWTVGAARER